ncbi:MAG: divalent-cation tolerance protein CutA [Planctomycetota bacterium]|nr:divalent-cation tolerance protein CutA [Planctomycetota bacterium]
MIRSHKSQNPGNGARVALAQLFLVTHPVDTADHLARNLVEEGLAACVNIVPGCRSIYRWEGKTCDEPESLLLIKSARQPVSDLIDEITKRHPHDCPEVIALPIEGGHEPYLRWVEENSSGKESP